MMNEKELQFIKDLIEALKRKCKTEALYQSCNRGIEIIDREFLEVIRK